MKLILLSALTLVAATGCSDDDRGPSVQLCESIVSFAGNSGGKARFEYRQIDDSPLITLWSQGTLEDSRVKEGTRLKMRYTLPTGIDPSEGGEVRILGLQLTLADTVSAVASAPQTLGALYLTTIQRSGEYINLTAQMPAVRTRSITVVVPSTPLADDGIADLYISAETETSATAYDSQATASLWVGPVWQRPDVRGVRVHLDNSNNPYRNEFTFLKQN